MRSVWHNLMNYTFICDFLSVCVFIKKLKIKGLGKICKTHEDNDTYSQVCLASVLARKERKEEYIWDNRNARKRQNKSLTRVYQEMTWRTEILPVNDRH